MSETLEQYNDRVQAYANGAADITELRWEEPEPITREGAGRKSKYAEILKALESRPGESLLVYEGELNTRNGQAAYLRKVLPGCKVTSRTASLGGGKFRVRIYAVWTGEYDDVMLAMELPAPDEE